MGRANELWSTCVIYLGMLGSAEPSILSGLLTNVMMMVPSLCDTPALALVGTPGFALLLAVVFCF